MQHTDLDNNSELDAYIDSLLADVGDDSEPPQEDVADDALEFLLQQSQTNGNDNPQSLSIQTQSKNIITDDSAPVSMTMEGQLHDDDEDQSPITDSNLKGQALLQEENNGTESLQTNTEVLHHGVKLQPSISLPSSSASPSPSRRRYPRPNALYRFLLDRGYLGRILVMFLIWLTEFVQTFFPPLANMISFILVTIFGRRNIASFDEDDDYYENLNNININSMARVNDQYVAFVDSRRTLRGRERKQAIQMADEKAVEQLRQVGSASEARFKYLSQDFMHRHGLGPYASSRSMTNVEDWNELSQTTADKKPQGKYTSSFPVDEDDDVDWVVNALTSDIPKPILKKNITSKKPSIDIGMSTEGVTVGVSFSIGTGNRINDDGVDDIKRKKSKRSHSKLIKAVTSNASETRISVKPGPRVSDREGGGGVLGRIRDFGANNLMSRSLLGAYPGDALAPTEAASATGLCDFAIKYGYGDWSSDEDDDNEEDDNDGQLSAMKKTKSKSHRRRRRNDESKPTLKRSPKSESSKKSKSESSRTLSSSSSFSLDFDFSTPPPKTSPAAVAKGSQARPKSMQQQQPNDTNRRRNSKMVRLPLERLREKDSIVSKDPIRALVVEKSSVIGAGMTAATRDERAKKMVRLPTERLREKEK